jgi:hypothetical protein
MDKDLFIKNLASKLPETEAESKLLSLSTEPADRLRAEKAIAELYKVNKFSKPKFFWVDSPNEAFMFIDLFTKSDIPDDWKDVVKAEMTKRQAPFVLTYNRGQQDFFWCANRDKFIEESRKVDIDQLIRLDCFYEISQSCHWVYLYEGAAIVCERPAQAHYDADDRYHNDSGYAKTYRDGTGWYAIHGVVVPEKVVLDPKGYTKNEIRGEKNSEVVRILAERMGWDLFAERIGVTLDDEWESDKSSYQLLSPKHKVGELQPNMLKMTSPVLKDGTSPVYVEPVDHRLSTAEQAYKWQIVPAGSMDEDELIEYCQESPEILVGIET